MAAACALASGCSGPASTTRRQLVGTPRVEIDGARRVVVAAQLLGEVAVLALLPGVDGRLAVPPDEAELRRLLLRHLQERRHQRLFALPRLHGRRIAEVVILGQLVSGMNLAGPLPPSTMITPAVTSSAETL